MRLIKKFSLLLALAFCIAQVALVGFGTNASACHDSGWIKPMDNTCHFGDCHHMRCFDHPDNNPNCAVADEQATPSEQSAATEEDSGYSVVVDAAKGTADGQSATGLTVANAVPIAVAIVTIGCVASGFVIFIKKKP